MTGPVPPGAGVVAGGDALERDWTRLHPLSPFVQFGRGLAVVALLVLERAATGTGQVGSVLVDVGLLVLALLGGVVHWAVTRWRVAGAELQVETGLLRRQSIRVPLARVQSVDLVRPALGRVVGLTEVRVESAGRGTDRARLAYLPDARAVAVRAQLLALAHGLDDRTPAPPEQPLWQVDDGRLVVSALLGIPWATLLVVAVAGGAAVAVGTGAPLAAVTGPAVPLLVTAVAAIGRRVVAEWDARVGRAGDGLRLTAGLVQTRAQTVPTGRVQAVRRVQPLLWRPLGWSRLEIDVPRQHRSGRRGNAADTAAVSRALAPVGPDEEVLRLVPWVLPGASAAVPGWARPPARARWKAPLSWWALAAVHDGEHVVTRTGRVHWRTVVVPLAKVQSVRWTQGPVQRWLRLASVHVDVAGRSWRCTAHDRDVEEARRLLSELPRLARDARGRESAAHAASSRARESAAHAASSRDDGAGAAPG